VQLAQCDAEDVEVVNGHRNLQTCAEYQWGRFQHGMMMGQRFSKKKEKKEETTHDTGDIKSELKSVG
jgi:hypothetical protein